MLTVDYDRLGLRRGDRVLDLGCGFGRHAFEAARRGAEVVALDAGADELRDVQAMFLAMVTEGELDVGSCHAGAVRADAGRLPFDDGAFDRVIAAEVLEHIPDDVRAMAELARVLRAGGTMAVTVPRCGPEVVNWLLSDAYHDVPGGHVRIYRRSALVRRLAACGLVPVARHHAHGLHTPYWWLRCLVGPANEAHAAVAAYHRLLVWEIVKRPRVTRIAGRLLDPLIGKSLVVYFVKPAATARPAPNGAGSRAGSSAGSSAGSRVGSSAGSSAGDRRREVVAA